MMPDGFFAVPVSVGQESAPLKLCVLVRQKPGAVSGYFQILRDTLDGLVYLGCVTDAAGRVRQWIELWVQDPSNLPTALPTAREAASNAVLDARWRRHAMAMDGLSPRSVIGTGWEEKNPLPTFIDLSSLKPVHPTAPDSQKQLEICRDESALAAANLPGYASTLHRYLYAPGVADSFFYPVMGESPTNDRTRPLASLLNGSTVVPFNPGAGLMFARESLALKFTSYVDFLGGSPAEETLQLNAHPGAGAKSESSHAGGMGGWLFLGPHGRWGRALEGFHLKLCSVAGAIYTVRELVRQTQVPMLNLTADSFRVKAAESFAGLPWLWTANVSLVTPGDVVELPLKSGETKYYLYGRDPGMSVYRPPTVGRATRGRALVRLRRVLTADGQVILEGTLTSPESLSVGPNDLVWLRFGIANQRLDLYARLESEVALTVGEWRFRTLEQRLPDAVVAQLKQAEGVSFNDVMFDVLPSMSAPCDLYALAVLAVRTLLVNGQRTLPVALDELLSLARQVASDVKAAGAQNPKGVQPLPERLAAIFKRDSRWLQSLGPQHLSFEPIPVEHAFDLIPRELWWDTLAALIRMFPGVGPDSDSSDYGQGRAGGLDRVFDRACEDFQGLLVRSRSLIVIDWKYNREIDSVLRNRLAKVGAPASSPASSPGGSPGGSYAASSPTAPTPSSPANGPVQTAGREMPQRFMGS